MSITGKNGKCKVSGNSINIMKGELQFDDFAVFTNLTVGLLYYFA